MEWVRKNISNILLGLACAAIVFGAGFAIYQGLQSQRSYQIQTAESAKAARDHAGEQVKRYCVPLAPDAERDCRREVEDSYRDYYKESRDLEAQRVTAIWTALMGAAALIGMAISIIGVALVWRTFKATRKTAKAAIRANRIAMADRRPYIAVEGIHLVDKGAELFVQVTLKNFGASVAHKFRMSISACYADIPFPSTKPTIAPLGPELGNMPPGAPSFAPITVKNFDAWKSKIEAGSAAVVVYGTVQFNDFIGEPHTNTFFQYTEGGDFKDSRFFVCPGW